MVTGFPCSFVKMIMEVPLMPQEKDRIGMLVDCNGIFAIAPTRVTNLREKTQFLKSFKNYHYSFCR